MEKKQGKTFSLKKSFLFVKKFSYSGRRPYVGMGGEQHPFPWACCSLRSFPRPGRPTTTSCCFLRREKRKPASWCEYLLLSAPFPCQFLPFSFLSSSMENIKDKSPISMKTSGEKGGPFSSSFSTKTSSTTIIYFFRLLNPFSCQAQAIS